MQPQASRRKAVRNALPSRRQWPARRRGVSMLLVMTSLSATLVLTYAFVQTQAVTSNVNKNAARRDLATQAAHAGATAGLNAMQSSTWQGVNSTLSAVIMSDSTSSTSYSVKYQPYQVPDGQTFGPEGALLVRIVSTGTWTAAAAGSSKTATPQTAQRTVEVVARLQPRFLGRTIGANDYALAEDVSVNAGGYDTIQDYALFAKSSSSTALTLDPGDRFEGNLFLYQQLQLFNDPGWSSTIRAQALTDLATLYVSGSGQNITMQHPHPIGGSITFNQYPSGSLQNDLSKCGVAWSRNSTMPTYPTTTYAGWQQYQLYAGGFTYTAQTVSSSLVNTTLTPGPMNPLGIFYINGSVTLNDNVTIQGTLVSTGTVTINGDNVQVTSYNWRGANGAGIVANVDLWPRLPAIVADSVTFSTGTSCLIEGAIAVQHAVSGAGCRYEYGTPSSVNFTGTATGSRLQQPYSQIQLLNSPNLSNVASDGSCSIWLQRDASGDWYPIVGVDAQHKILTVVGEVNVTSATNYKVLPTKAQYIAIRGPVSASTCQLNGDSDWNLWSFFWNQLYSAWQSDTYNSKTKTYSQTFIAWLANPNNYGDWTYPYGTYGLPLEPTFHARATPNINYLWAPPLFTPYSGTGTGAAYSGYRWGVVSWRVTN